MVIFSLAAVEKLNLLRTNAAAWHPIMLASPRRRHNATLLMALGLGADLVVVALLLSQPARGSVVAAILVLGYSIAAMGVPESVGGSSCRCLWKVMNTWTRSGLLVRNSMFVGLAALARVQPVVQITRESLVWAGLLFVIVTGLSGAVDWIARRLAPSQEESVPVNIAVGSMSEVGQRDRAAGGNEGGK